MQGDLVLIEKISINDKGIMYIKARNECFNMIYRSAMGVHWDDKNNYLYFNAPITQDSDILKAYEQIVSAVKAEYGKELKVNPQTQFQNISDKIRDNMQKIFDENDYNFTDSTIIKIEWADNLNDLLIKIDYFMGEHKSKILTLKLKNIKELSFHNQEPTNNAITTFTVAHISKKAVGNNVQLTIESVLSYLSGRENDGALINCTCENVFVEHCVDTLPIIHKGEG